MVGSQGPVSIKNMDTPRDFKKVPLTFRGVQALRGFAACLVVVHHSSQSWLERSGDLHQRLWSSGAVGVDVFFVISGFVMALSAIGKDDGARPALKFMERRITRVVPLYWIFTVAAWLKMVVVQLHPQWAAEANHVTTPWTYVTASLFFIPYRNSRGLVQPLLAIGWTLYFEMFFYLLFAFCIALRLNVIRWLTPILLSLSFVGLMNQSNWPSVATLASPLLLEFLGGLLLGRLVSLNFRLNTATSVLLGCAGLAGIAFFPPPASLGMRAAEWGGSALLLVCAVAMLEVRFGGWIPQWALRIGDASYSLYLSHFLLIGTLVKLAMGVHGLNGRVGIRYELPTVLFCVVFCVFFALLFYKFIEDPINRALRRRLHLRPLKRTRQAQA